jgi:PAS domain S-box-containing protein
MPNRKSPQWNSAILLDEILHSSPLGIHHYELNHDRLVFTGANPAAEAILGISHTELVGKTIEEAFPPLGSTEIPMRYKEVANSGKTWETEQVLYEDDRISGAFHVYAFQPSPGHVSAMFRDITEKKKAEASILESEEKFRQLAENISDIFWLREGKRFLYTNPSFERVFGLNHETINHHPEAIIRIIHPDDKSTFRVFADTDTLISEGLITEQFRIVKPDGSIHWIWSRVFPVFDKTGELYRVAGIASDITEQKELENALREAKDKAQESDRLKSSLLANISHEIRTPLNGILGFVNLLIQTDHRDQNRERYLDIIRKSSDQLLHIIEDLIDISRIEAQQMHLTLGACDINTLIDELHAIYVRELYQLGKRDIELIPIYSLDMDNGKILTDGLRLRQVFINLMNNAVKYTDKGHIRFGYEMEGSSSIRFFVEDTGIGIDPAKFNVIFQPFRQVDEGNARKYGGTGLGLPISRGLVSLLNGEIWLESAVGEGARFYFRIPFRPYQEKKKIGEPVADDVENPNWANRRILIVEDDDMNFEFLNTLLLPTSVVIERARDGIRAVSMCREGSFHLVLMDIRVPLLDGIQATKQIRESGITIPIIAQTAFAMSNDKQKCLDAGCSDYIPKPINSNILMLVLSRYLTR